MKKIFITSCGAYLPQKIVSNDDLTKIIDTSDEWIVSRTGIKNRHIANKQESTSYMAIQAAKEAISQHLEIADKIDAIIVATTTPDQMFPSTATKVHAALGLKNICAFDVQAVCSGFIYAASVATSMIKAGAATTVLVIGVDKMSKILNWKDRNTCILFGDGAGAVILTENAEKNNSGIIDFNLSADGNLGQILHTSGEINSAEPCGHVVMQGKEVFRHAVEKMSSSMELLLTSNKISINNIDWIIPHQANIRIINAIAAKMNIPIEKIVRTLRNQANTSAATIPLALYSQFKHGQLKRGDLIMLAAAGGGFTWGSMLLRW